MTTQIHWTSNQPDTVICGFLFFFFKTACQFWPKLSRYTYKGMKLGKNSLGHPKGNTSHTLMKEANFIGLSALLRGGSACNTWAHHGCVQLNSTLCTAKWSPPPKAKAGNWVPATAMRTQNPNYSTTWEVLFYMWSFVQSGTCQFKNLNRQWSSLWLLIMSFNQF